MKHSVSVIAIVALSILAGCTISKVAYRNKTTLTQAATAGQYNVAFLIEDVSDPANPSVVNSPSIRLFKGEEGSAYVGNETSGVTCTALVDDASGKPEAQTTVSVKKDGKVVWSEKQTVPMSKHRKSYRKSY